MYPRTKKSLPFERLRKMICTVLTHDVGASYAAMLCPDYTAGIIDRLLEATAAYTPRGDIGAMTDDEIAEKLNWQREPSELVNALVVAGWLERCSTHRLVFRDWQTHCDDSQLVKRARNGEIALLAGAVAPTDSSAPSHGEQRGSCQAKPILRANVRTTNSGGAGRQVVRYTARGVCRRPLRPSPKPAAAVSSLTAPRKSRKLVPAQCGDVQATPVALDTKGVFQVCDDRPVTEAQVRLALRECGIDQIDAVIADRVMSLRECVVTAARFKSRPGLWGPGALFRVLTEAGYQLPPPNPPGMTAAQAGLLRKRLGANGVVATSQVVQDAAHPFEDCMAIIVYHETAPGGLGPGALCTKLITPRSKWPEWLRDSDESTAVMLDATDVDRRLTPDRTSDGFEPMNGGRERARRLSSMLESKWGSAFDRLSYADRIRLAEELGPSGSGSSTDARLACLLHMEDHPQLFADTQQQERVAA